MTFGLFPAVRNIGPRVQVTWSDRNVDGYLEIDGYVGDYSSIVGGESIIIKAGGDSNTPPTTQTIIFHPGDNSINAIINRIDGYFPGLTIQVKDSLRLRDGYYVEFVDYGNNDDIFKIGLLRGIKEASVVHNLLRKSDAFIQEDRLDVISDPINIDPGSNVITIWPTVYIASDTDGYAPSLAICWGNGIDGYTPPDFNTSPIPGLEGFFNYGRVLPQFAGLPTYTLSIAPMIGNITYNIQPTVYQPRNGLFPSGGLIFPVWLEPIKLEVPRGSTQLRILVLPPTQVPVVLQPPWFSAAVTQGAE